MDDPADNGVTAPRTGAHCCAAITPGAVAETPTARRLPRSGRASSKRWRPSANGAHDAAVRCSSAKASGLDFHVVLAGAGRGLRGRGSGSAVGRRTRPLRFLGELGLLTDGPRSDGGRRRSRGRCSSPRSSRSARGGPRRGLRRSDPARLHPAALDAARPAGRPANHRLGVLGGHPPAVRVRGAQPHPAQLDRRRGRARRPRPCCSNSGSRPEETPVVVLSGDDRAAGPGPTPTSPGSSGCRRRRRSRRVCDVVVVGRGPGRPRRDVTAPRRGSPRSRSTPSPPAGRPRTSSRIENYLGFPSGISGAELAERAPCRPRSSAPASSVPARRRRSSTATATTSSGWKTATEIAARTVRGRHRRALRRLEVAGHGALEGTGMFYAATDGRGDLCRGDAVAIVGGGNSAGQAATFLASTRAAVDGRRARAGLARHMSRYRIDRMERAPNAEVLLHSEVAGGRRQRRLEGAEVVDNRTGERGRMDARALFGFIGAVPFTAVAARRPGARRQREHPHRGRRPLRAAAAGRDVAPTRSRRASPASSRWATCATGRRCAWPPPWAREPWPSDWCTSTSPIATASSAPRTRAAVDRRHPRPTPAGAGPAITTRRADAAQEATCDQHDDRPGLRSRHRA